MTPRRVNRMRFWRWLILPAMFVLMGLSCAQSPPATSDLAPITFSEDVVDHMTVIYGVGQLSGNHPNVFTTIGDSITVSGNFLQPIGYGLVELGDYDHLQTVIDYYAAAPVNPFLRSSVAAGVGWAAWGALDPALTENVACSPVESPLTCEMRITRPSIALIMFGTNDLHYRTADQFEADLTRIIDQTLAQGVIPVLSTIPPQPAQPDAVERFNAVIVQLATENSLPLWDYHALMLNLPNQGLTWDNLHPSSPPEWFDQAAIFTPEYLQYGYVMRNLSALMMLDAIYTAVQAPWWGLCDADC